MSPDFHASLVIDAAGEIMGSGISEWQAIESAARNLQMETWDIEELIKKATNGYQGEEETLSLSTRQKWEETAGMTVEEYLGGSAK